MRRHTEGAVHADPNRHVASTVGIEPRKEPQMQVCRAREDYVRWLLIARDLSPHTVRAYDGDIAAFERHLGRGALVRQIDRSRLLAFMEEQRKAGLSSSSMRRRASGLRGFSRWLLAARLLDDDPWMGTRVAVGRSRKLPRILPAHELERLLRWLRSNAGLDDNRPLPAVLDRPHQSTTLLAVTLMVATGVRVTETVGIKCHDIDLTGQSVRILGKGRRERQVFLTNDWLTALTRTYLETRAGLGLDHAYLLFNELRGPLTESAMRARLVKAGREAGLRTRVTPHILRHTAATQLIEAGVDIRYIQRLLGHASLNTTEIYTHVSDRALRRVVSDADVVGRFLTGNR
jgi:site-specific recombinase XerD